MKKLLYILSFIIVGYFLFFNNNISTNDNEMIINIDSSIINHSKIPDNI